MVKYMNGKTEIILRIVGVSFAIWLIYMTFFPHKIECNVQSINWDRTIYIEELITYHEDGWSLPSDARLKYSKRERHHYDDEDEKWVYKTRYYYDIDRWTVVRQYESSGNDKECYWNDNYILRNKERDIKRDEKYKITFVGEDDTYVENVNYEDYVNFNLKEKYIVTTSNFGIVYGSKIID